MNLDGTGPGDCRGYALPITFFFAAKPGNMFRPASELGRSTRVHVKGRGREGTWTGGLAYVMTGPLRPPPQASCEGVWR